MKKILLTFTEKNEIINYKTNNSFPSRLINRDDKKKFKKRALQFAICSDDLTGLYYKKTATIKLKIFSIEEHNSLIDFIRFKHIENGYLRRNRLESVLIRCFYNVRRENIFEVLRSCLQYSARDLMTTRRL
ncbi:hypothetical protein DMUE_2815 [Dictyocoela muelleri]|nr:hypothetical protein DMUE_2815 [Dictyocoela muelleri]